MATMQLEFAQAMTDFKTMFPDMDHEVIEAVLRANQGAVDATIDQLLAMSTDTQNEKLRNELDGSIAPQQSLINLIDTDYEKQRNRLNITQPATAQLIDTTDGNNFAAHNPINTPAAAANAVLLNLSNSGPNSSPHHNTGASPKQRPQQNNLQKNILSGTAAPTTHTNVGRRWNPPILGPLPAGFLRIAPSVTHDAGRDFDLPDEQFAMMLQNEEFMNQLRWNQEFMNALEKEQSGKAKTEDDAAFKERLKHMGKVSRKKFLQMARVFTWQRNKKVTTAKQIDSLPLKEEPSDDEEHHHHHHQHNQQVRK
ncbi:CUE domain-containing protein 1 isoform X2 [Teleopsis dalmanni]|uniref:CUE domain-containing protein 1 isoform X2 n=1 Tax=Teleopsis dalmanni TaxID=139649 RepID=UPI0018CEF3B0|nr:CUE domain-containing protein 1 isoform X2 [Teleopsis dalmanni]